MIDDINAMIDANLQIYMPLDYYRHVQLFYTVILRVLELNRVNGKASEKETQSLMILFILRISIVNAVNAQNCLILFLKVLDTIFEYNGCTNCLVLFLNTLDTSLYQTKTDIEAGIQ